MKIYVNFLRQKCRSKHLVLAMYHLRWYDVGNPSIGGLNARRVAKYSDFGLIEGNISETVQDRRYVSINH